MMCVLHAIYGWRKLSSGTKTYNREEDVAIIAYLHDIYNTSNQQMHVYDTGTHVHHVWITVYAKITKD